MSKISENNRQKFLLTFFESDKYSENEINGFWLVKHWNGGNKSWEVAIYTKESYENYKKYNRGEFESQYQQDLQMIKNLK